jgi:CRISPR-associated protein (TIGR03984 family)
VPDNELKWNIDYKVDFTDFDDDPRQWFASQGQTRGLTYFLAHADDGVIWGRVVSGQLKLSGEAFSEVQVTLRTVTLQQARLFDKSGELLVWREDKGWRGRYLTDADVTQNDRLDETHRLWGTASDPPGPTDGFTLMQDGVQGLLHAPPLSLAKGESAVLRVRHYLAEDEQGQAYIALSRLMTVEKGGR